MIEGDIPASMVFLDNYGNVPAHRGMHGAKPAGVRGDGTIGMTFSHLMYTHSFAS